MNEEIKNIIKYLKEYEKLCQKYKMGLKGCGCCGSPYLDFFGDVDIDYVNYDKSKNCILIDGKNINDYFTNNIKNIGDKKWNFIK